MKAHPEESGLFLMDILLSWNFKHLANYQRKKNIQLVNIKNNFTYPIDILTPMEVIYENN